jgi:cell division septation protein DedD
MSKERFVGLIFLIAIFSFSIIKYYPQNSEVDEFFPPQNSFSESPKKSNNFREFKESDFDFFVYRAHVLSSKENADKLVERVLNSGFPSFVESFGENGDLFAIYVGPFLSKDDIVNNMDLIQVVSESSNGEISRWKL